MKKINKRIFGVLKIDADVFSEIKQYVKTYYDEYHVEIKKEYGTYGEPIELSNAYAEIINDKDNIECVKITAQKGDSNCVIYLNNKKGLHKSTFKLKANVYDDKELVTHLFVNKIEEMMAKKIYVPAERYLNTIISCVFSIALVLVNKYYDGSYVAIGIYFVAAITIGSFCPLIISPLIKMKSNDYNWILFTIDTETAEEHSERQKYIKIHNMVNFILTFIIVGLGTYIIVLGG